MKKRYRFRIWIYEICHGATPFMNRMCMLESCVGVTEFDTWEELGKALDKGISVDGQQVSRVEIIGDMRSTGEFYDAIGNAHKAGIHDHPTYHLPPVTPASS